MKVMVLGANGMLGNAIMQSFSQIAGLSFWGTVRSERAKILFPPNLQKNLITGVDVTQIDHLKSLLLEYEPDITINCIGLVKQHADANEAQQAITLNALLPHQLADLTKEMGARLMLISTDCVFSGLKGEAYTENDLADPVDLYGKTKFLGEIANRSHVLTLRTSYIGNEMMGEMPSHGLLEWFLSQSQSVKGFTRAIYSGLPTVVLSSLIRDTLLSRPDLSGLYHVSSEPISKYNLLQLLNIQFEKQLEVVPDDQLEINRSLDSTRLLNVTGFRAPSWEAMIHTMYLDRISHV